MRIGIFTNTAATNGVKIMDAFCKGIRSTGDEYIVINNVTDQVDAIVLWSLVWNKNRKQIYDYYRNLNIPIIIIEVGGLIRNKSWKIGLNHLDVRGFPYKIKNRWPLFNLELKPYHKGENILLCGQNENSGLWPEKYTTKLWVEQTTKEIRKNFKNTIIFRPHPRYYTNLNIPNVIIEKPNFMGGYDNYDLEKKLPNTLLLCNYNSNPSISATINGTFIHTNKNSLCHSVSIKNLKTLNSISDVDRTEWCEFISGTEWFEEEIKMGIPYKLIREFI